MFPKPVYQHDSSPSLNISTNISTPTFYYYPATLKYWQRCWNLLRIDPFETAHGWGRGHKASPFYKSVIDIPQQWNLAQLYRSKKHVNFVAHPSSFADISIFFHQKLAIFVILGNTAKNCILIHFSGFLWLLLSLSRLF